MTTFYLLYGNGWIGKQFQTILQQQKIPFHLSNNRADDPITVESEINTLKPSHIIATIGRTHGIYNNIMIPTIDYLEKPDKLVENIRDNLYGPITLARLAEKYNIHLTYIGTGCIYSYDDEHPEGNPNTGFKETDTPNFTGSSYSTVKGFTDKLMDNYSTTLNVRIRMPIINGQDDRDFITKILKYDKICDMPNSMSVLPTLLPLVIDMAQKKVTGKINLTNPGLISHNQILSMYKSHIDPTFTWKNFTIDEQNQLLLSKRSNNCLNTNKLSTMYPDVPNIHDAILSIIKNMKNMNKIYEVNNQK